MTRIRPRDGRQPRRPAAGFPPMTRLFRIVALFGAMVAAATAASTAQAATFKSCGDAKPSKGYAYFDYPMNVKARGVNCFTAKLLAGRHMDTCDLDRAKCQIDFWTCKRSFFGNSGTRVRCAYGARRVKFIY